ncbi:MAG: HigA family addiction module antitoxin [Anaerolineales bacterium]
MIGKYLPVPHPGEILLEDYLKPMGISQNRLALAMRVPPNRISEIVNGKRSISAETALRIGRALGTSGELWLGLQMEYDIRVAKQITSEIIEQEVIPIY